MSTPTPPPGTPWSELVYGFGVPGQDGTAEWIDWNFATQGNLTIQFPNGLPVGSVWIPQLVNNVTFNFSPTPYTTQSTGAECVPVPPGTFTVVLSAPSGTMSIYASTLAYPPFRAGAQDEQVSQVTAEVPLFISGPVAQPDVNLTVPLATTYGGTGSMNPVGVYNNDGSIVVSGDFPDQQISAVAHGVADVTGTFPVIVNNGAGPTVGISLAVVPISVGGNGSTSPGIQAGTGIGVSSPTHWPNQTVSNLGVTSLDTQRGDVVLTGIDGILVSAASGFVTVGGGLLVETINSPDGSVTVTRTGQVVSLEVAATNAPKVFSGTNPVPLTSPIINIGVVQINLSGTDGPNAHTSGSANVTFGKPFTNTNYAVSLAGETDWVMTRIDSKSLNGFILNVGNPFNLSPQTLFFDYIAIGN